MYEYNENADDELKTSESMREWCNSFEILYALISNLINDFIVSF